MFYYQQRVPKGEKIRKEKISQRERKFEKYNRSAKEKRKQESIALKLRREVNIDNFSRPKG